MPCSLHQTYTHNIDKITCPNILAVAIWAESSDFSCRLLRVRPLRASLRERGKPGAQAWLLDIATVLPVLPQGNWRTAPGGAQPLALDTGHDRNDTDRFERGWIAKPSRSLVLAARNFCGTTMTWLPFSNDAGLRSQVHERDHEME